MKVLEDLLLKDNENMPPFDDLVLEPSEAPGFALSELVRCEECLRANPPTRATCLYCGHALPVSEAGKAAAKPSLRPLEKWEQGYNIVLLTSAGEQVTSETVGQLATLLRLEQNVLQRIFDANRPLPVARSAGPEEASLIESRMSDRGVRTVTIADSDLGGSDLTRRTRALDLGAAELKFCDLSGNAAGNITWDEVTLLVIGRLITRRIALKERTRRRGENEIVDASETASDQSVLDIYDRTNKDPWRIVSTSFDFSCLGSGKSLLAAENFTQLVRTIRERSTRSTYDESFNVMQRLIEPVWPAERTTESMGWARSGIGKVTTGGLTTVSNESQFNRYSHLLRYMTAQL